MGDVRSDKCLECLKYLELKKSFLALCIGMAKLRANEGWTEQSEFGEANEALRRITQKGFTYFCWNSSKAAEWAEA